MKKKRGNPSWGKPDFHPTTPIQPNSFEQVVRGLRLSPDQYAGSAQLKEWVRKNKDQKYVPSDLLEAWDFDAASEV
jgi:hypothetical protein